jgi:hypothetical protein
MMLKNTRMRKTISLSLRLRRDVIPQRINHNYCGQGLALPADLMVDFASRSVSLSKQPSR